MNALEWILEKKIIAILRGVLPSNMLDVVQALHEGGVTVLEITLNSQDAISQIRKITEQYSGTMLIGAGTVLDMEGARAAKDAGAKFLISPGLDEKVVQFARDNNLVSIPGAYTPTEILRAHRAGADIVKIFPVSDPAYLKSVSAPLGHIKMMPTGGINTQNIHEFARAGAVAFGIGSALVSKHFIMDDDYLAGIRSRAEGFVRAAASI